MFNVSIREYFSVLNVFIVCIRNTAMFKLTLLLCTLVYSYMFSTVHPPRAVKFNISCELLTYISYFQKIEVGPKPMESCEWRHVEPCECVFKCLFNAINYSLW